MKATARACALTAVLLSLLTFISGCTRSAVTSDRTSLSDPSQPGNDSTRQNPSETLYHRLGGKSGVETLTEQFIIEIAADETLRPRFAKSDIGRFHRMMQEHVCELSDGPCQYTGDNMKRTHGGMNIRSSEFNSVVEALMRAMDSMKLPISTQNQLLARLAALQPEVIGQ